VCHSSIVLQLLFGDGGGGRTLTALGRSATVGAGRVKCLQGTTKPAVKRALAHEQAIWARRGSPMALCWYPARCRASSA